MTYLYTTQMRPSGILIAAPAGACLLGHSCVAALEKALTHQIMAIVCELRLVVTKMKNSHLHRLNVSLHQR